MGDIYVAQAGEQRGPFTAFEILRMVEAGELSRDDLWWKDGMAGWESLATLLPPPAPPAPPSYPEPPPYPSPPAEISYPGANVPYIKLERPRFGLVLYLCLFAGAFVLVGIICVGAIVSVQALAVRSRQAAAGKSSSYAPSTPGPTTRKAARTEKPRSDTWRRFSLDGVTISSPVPMKPYELPLEDSGKGKKLVVSSLGRQGESDTLWIGLSVVKYAPNAIVSLDGAEESSMKMLASQLQIAVPEYTTTHLTVQGLPAIRIDSSFSLPVDDQSYPVNLRLLLVKARQRVIQVITLQYEAEAAADAESVLSSLAIPAGS